MIIYHQGGAENFPKRNITQRSKNHRKNQIEMEMSHQGKELVTKKNRGCHQGREEGVGRRDGQYTEYMNRFIDF